MSEGTVVIKSNKRKLGDEEEEEDEEDDEKANIIPKFLSADPKNH